MASPQSGWGGTQAPSGGGGSASGWGGTSAPVSAAPAKGGGGILGAVEHTLGGGAHWIASKADLAAHDIKAIPGGVVKQAIDVATVPGGWHTAGQQWIDLLHGNLHWAPGDPLRQDIAAQAKGALTSVEHPGRDPFQTAFTVGALAAPVAGGVARVGYIGEALDAAKAAETAGDTATASSLRGAAVRAAVSPLHKPPVSRCWLTCMHGGVRSVFHKTARSGNSSPRRDTTNWLSFASTMTSKRMNGSAFRYQSREH